MHRTATRISLRAVWLLIPGLLVTGGCGLKWEVVGPKGIEPCVGPLRVEASPVDVTRLGRDHPFRWRGTEKAAFLLFDVKITNTGERDVLCQVGHLDFPGTVAPIVAALGAPAAGRSDGTLVSDPGRLIGPDDLQIASLTHERATVLMSDGHRLAMLEYADFCERFSYIQQRELLRAEAVGMTRYIPYSFGAGGLASSIMRHSATKHMPERLMKAQQMVMRPGVVPAGATVRGYLVFAWPEDAEPGTLTLRLPIQPGHTASIQFDLVRRGS